MSSELNDILLSAFRNPLPGIEAQLLMAPYHRKIELKEENVYETAKKGAVLILISPDSKKEPCITLIQRNVYDGVHSGQVSFPGGKVEPFDYTYQQAALRETKEEIGIEIHPSHIIGQLTEVYIPPSRFLVFPFVAFSNEIPPYNPDSREVNKIIQLPIKELLNEQIVVQKKVKVASLNATILTPCFYVQESIVWGATAMMLSELKVMLQTTFR
jgi:8-oxo-dGTP pyrophosphatase MutT (NUDIX family)